MNLPCQFHHASQTWKTQLTWLQSWQMIWLLDTPRVYSPSMSQPVNESVDGQDPSRTPEHCSLKPLPVDKTVRLLWEMSDPVGTVPPVPHNQIQQGIFSAVQDLVRKIHQPTSFEACSWLDKKQDRSWKPSAMDKSFVPMLTAWICAMQWLMVFGFGGCWFQQQLWFMISFQDPESACKPSALHHGPPLATYHLRQSNNFHPSDSNEHGAKPSMIQGQLLREVFNPETLNELRLSWVVPVGVKNSVDIQRGDGSSNKKSKKLALPHPI